jgi:hypothetical protein
MRQTPKQHPNMNEFERSTIKWARAAVIMSFLAALFVCLQWNEMRKGGADTHDLADAAKKQTITAAAALVSVQRAFISARFPPQIIVDTDSASKPPYTWKFFVYLDNSGLTPTRNAVSYFNVAAFPGPIPKTYNYPDFGGGEKEDFARFYVAPKGFWSTGAYGLDGEKIRLTRERQLHPFVWGWTTYNDVFSNTPLHITMFCEELYKITGNLTNPDPGQVTWNICPHHNCADDECKGESYGTPTRIWQ